MNPLVGARVAALCTLGCARIRALLAQAERGLPLPELADLDQAAQREVLAELASIMAVYDARDLRDDVA